MARVLPQKWKNHINKMCEYAKKSEEMRKELEEYLISKGFEGDMYDSGCDFEDSIIDSMQNGDSKGLIVEIEHALNGRDRLTGTRLEESD